MGSSQQETCNISEKGQDRTKVTIDDSAVATVEATEAAASVEI